MRVLGVDACRAGWVGVVLDGGAAVARVASTVATLVDDLEVDGPLAAIGIDIPIGLPDTGIGVPDDIGHAGRQAAVDDVLDAAAAAWTAARVAAGTATPVPDPPVTHEDGWPAAIWV